MNKTQFISEIKEIDTDYLQSESSQLDTTRIFFFEKSQTVVLIDSCNGYKMAFKTPEFALAKIQSWVDEIDFDLSLDQSEKEEELDLINSQEFQENENKYLAELERESQSAKSPFADFFA